MLFGLIPDHLKIFQHLHFIVQSHLAMFAVSHAWNGCW